MTAAHTYGLADVGRALAVDPRTVQRWLAVNADDAGHRSHIEVGGVRVPAFRAGRSWRIAGVPFDRVLTGEGAVA